ncbi:MAG TPA: hypothetical protein VFV57_12610 [Limnobacter sp.]|nr:hypothetical protein [Limnobacter sp.]
MIESIANLNTPLGQGLSHQPPSAADVSTFSNLMQPSNQVQGAVESFVVKAENRVERGELQVASKLKEFSYKDNVISLVNAMHESSMNSVSIQLTGKIGTKVSENFESLIKQQ